MIEVVILISIMWVVMTAIFFFLLSKNEGTKGITSEYFTKDGVKRTAKKEREDYIVWIKPSAS